MVTISRDCRACACIVYTPTKKPNLRVEHPISFPTYYHILPFLQVGGGAFQGRTLNQYAHMHRGHECYSFKLGECTSHRYMTEIPDLIHNAV